MRTKYTDSTAVISLADSLKELIDCDTTFVCVGSDRSTGDSFGPLVGSRLKLLGYNVVGTLDDPVHGQNLCNRTVSLPDNNVFAIDACLGRLESIGDLVLNTGPISPGLGVGKVLAEVGNNNLTAVVNAGGFMEYLVLQNTRLSLVMDMVDVTVDAITKSLRANKVCAHSLVDQAAVF